VKGLEFVSKLGRPTLSFNPKPIYLRSRNWTGPSFILLVHMYMYSNVCVPYIYTYMSIYVTQLTLGSYRFTPPMRRRDMMEQQFYTHATCKCRSKQPEVPS
jgi:hypothetical protein